MPARALKISSARCWADPLPADTILNVNVPDLPWSEVKGFEVTRLGNRHRAEGCIAQKDPRGNEVYWIGPAGREQDSGPGTDFHAVRTGHISITPIQVDLTRYQALEKVASWVGGLSAALDQPALLDLLAEPCGIGAPEPLAFVAEPLGLAEQPTAQVPPAARARPTPGLRDAVHQCSSARVLPSNAPSMLRVALFTRPSR